MLQSCCSWRSHTAFLYLNSPDGGSFVFQDDLKRFSVIKPLPGRLIMLSSGVENVHGVSRIRSGTRYAFGIWFTKDYSRSYLERRFQVDTTPVADDFGRSNTAGDHASTVETEHTLAQHRTER